jgi:hypothetical protein
MSTLTIPPGQVLVITQAEVRVQTSPGTSVAVLLGRNGSSASLIATQNVVAGADGLVVMTVPLPTGSSVKRV